MTPTPTDHVCLNLAQVIRVIVEVKRTILTVGCSPQFSTTTLLLTNVSNHKPQIYSGLEMESCVYYEDLRHLLKSEEVTCIISILTHGYKNH